MMILDYASKKELKAAIGQKLKYKETSMFGEEYNPNGKFVGCNRPSLNPRIPKGSREFFAEVTMKDGLIFKVT
jgi:hypothetical protein